MVTQPQPQNNKSELNTNFNFLLFQYTLTKLQATSGASGAAGKAGVRVLPLGRLEAGGGSRWIGLRVCVLIWWEDSIY